MLFPNQLLFLNHGTYPERNLNFSFQLFLFYKLFYLYLEPRPERVLHLHVLFSYGIPVWKRIPDCLKLILQFGLYLHISVHSNPDPCLISSSFQSNRYYPLNPDPNLISLKSQPWCYPRSPGYPYLLLVLILSGLKSRPHFQPILYGQ